jgi:N,N'-diacetylchitobiose phosphorylase
VAELRLTDPDDLLFFVRDEDSGESAPPGVEAVIESPQADAGVVLRRVRLRNASKRPRRLTLTSYAGIVLHDAAAHAAHPGFSKLFVQTRLDAAGEVLLARRRPRGSEPAPPELAHALLGPGAASFETDRARFLGRGRSLARPAAQGPGAALTGTLGNVLDPIASWRRGVTLAPGEAAEWIAVLALGATGAEAAAHARSAAARCAGEPTAASPKRGAALAPPGPARYRRSDLPHDVAAAAAPEPLLFDNGTGGFSQDGRAYVIRVAAGADGPRLPPMPWVNVIANPGFGTLVSERGAANTWSRNSREHRLTPWSNDPIADPHGEALWIRDEEAFVFWSPQPGPTPARASYEVRHGFGESSWTHESHDLAQEVVTLVAPDAPLKLTRLVLENRSARERRLSVFSYAQLVLGVLPEDARAVSVEAPDERTLLAWNPLAGVFADGVAFARVTSDAADGAASQSGDRQAFLGAGGDAERPRALAHDAALDGRTGAQDYPCFAQQLRVRLAPGGRLACTFLLGEATSRAETEALLARFSRPGAFDEARAAVRGDWERTLGAIRIATPSPALDVLVNGWLAYQTLSCRIHGRTAFYQSGGAFGFRDQLQDAAALVALRPDLTRRQILLHAAHQFVEGDVLHWWHPPHERGTRTRFSDDLLWLPSLAAHYVAVTGDAAVLDETAGFVTARALAPGEDEAYLQAEPARESASVYEHCCRAIERSLRVGAHGLPLMGTGDWNDGMNRVGREGRGESVWMGFFLFDLLRRFEPLCRARGDAERAERYAAHRAALARALEANAWDGAWYRRAWFDDGTPLGTAAAEECRIDVLPQAWATLSGAAPRARCETALDSALRELVLPEGGLIRLLTPPFDQMPQEPGYIKGYVPGIRENGGQYTHAACWLVRAAAQLGRREQALALLEMILPVNHARTPAEVATYQVEPYVVAADVYAVRPHVGRGGWTWYTGSSGWLLRVALESVLGLSVEDGARLVLRPCVPDAWREYRIDYRPLGGDTRYVIAVTNPSGCAARVVEVALDGAQLAPTDGAAVVPLAHDGRAHQLTITLGR